MRLTKHRKDILDTLASQHGTLSATALNTALPHINLVTIYRTLETLTEAGLIKKMNFGTNEAVYEHQTEAHHHAICTDCGRVIHFTAPDEHIKKLLGLSDFVIIDLEVTVRGHCHHKIAKVSK